MVVAEVVDLVVVAVVVMVADKSVKKCNFNNDDWIFVE